jgi:hypothetical protein
VAVFIGNSALPILATQGGLVEHLVKLNDKVEAGQKVAIQRNSFGEVVAEYTSSVAGEVTGQRSEAMSEPGNPPDVYPFQQGAPGGRGVLSRVVHPCAISKKKCNINNRPLLAMRKPKTLCEMSSAATDLSIRTDPW